ncbi:MAG: NADH-quinone oxidoreductase subunit NuoE [Bacteroidia bacterium]|jgi:NADH-quinone oxidoreductase subunit E|nr:NADH-quinone oxidoreductase subunit NuoE [Bacteroidia bacterium]MCC6768167.1 NADH-quinone oxidoreductase subunit NuoE [Bacteroidia bacterium]
MSNEQGVKKFDPEKRKTIRFSEPALESIQKIIQRYPAGKQKSAMLPVLHIAQAESDGWLSPEVLDYVAEILGLLPVEVYEVASFYSMYNLKPVGKCVLEVCQTSSCWTRGAEDVVEYIGKKLNIKAGETTSDGMFTLKTVECLGSCGTAPMLQCGAEYHENLTEERIDNLIERYRKEDRRRNYTDLDFVNSN